MAGGAGTAHLVVGRLRRLPRHPADVFPRRRSRASRQLLDELRGHLLWCAVVWWAQLYPAQLFELVSKARLGRGFKRLFIKNKRLPGNFVQVSLPFD